MSSFNHLTRSRKRLAVAFTLLLGVTLIAAALYIRAARESMPEAAAMPATQSPPASEGGLAAADLNSDGIIYQDGMHPWYVQDEPGIAPDCGMELTPVRVSIGEEGVVTVSSATLQNIGVRTATVALAPLDRSMRTTGRFEASEQLTTVVSPKVSGWVEKLYVSYAGARVAAGQPLMEIYSPELVSTQEEYLLALRNFQRLEASPAAADARRLLEAAGRRLQYWDITREQILRLEQEDTPQKTLTLYAPASGTVTEMNIIQGQQVEAGQTAMQLANLSRLWLMVDVYEQDLGWVRPGVLAAVELPYDPGRRLSGRVDYIYDQLDPTTRTARARVTVANADLALKPGMYATVTLTGGETASYPVIPEEALIRTGDRAIVILALGSGRFMPAEVVPGMQSGGRIQIISGLQGGEEVVTSAQFLIDSEARLQSVVGAMMSGRDYSAPAESGGTPDLPLSRAGTAPHPDMPAGHQNPSGSIPNEEGVQVVQITIAQAGYEPQAVRLKAGVPAKLVFTRTTDSTCGTEVHIPAFGIKNIGLPLNEPVAIEITPRQTGTFTFACGMDMLKGTLVIAS